MQDPNTISELQLPQVAALLNEQDQEGGLQLDRFVSALKRHLLLIAGVTTLTASAAVLKAVTDTPTYQAGFELLTPPVTLETQIISTISPDSLSNQPEALGFGLDNTKLKILTSPRVMEPIVEELQVSHPDITYGEIIGNLRIVPDETGRTLTVQYQSENPEKVSDVLKVVADAYIRYSLEDRQNDIYRGIDFVDQQLPTVRQRVEELQAELEALRQRSNLIDPLIQGQQLSEQTAKFTAEQLDLRVRIEQYKELYQDLQQELSQGELASNSALLESERYQSLLNQILEVDTQIAEDLALYLEDSPEIEVVEERRENLQPLLEREGIRVQEQVASYIRELEDQDRALSETIENLNQRTKSLSTVARQYTDIQRELDIATTNLNQFLTKREALRIEAAQRQTPWEILTPPGKPIASAASAKRNLVLGTTLGLLIGSGVAILVDRMGGKIHTVKELKEAARVPLLSTIPHNQLLEEGQPLALTMNHLGEMGFDLSSSYNNGHVEKAQVSTPFLEAFRILATNIRLSNPDHPIRALAVSSALPNAGKSTISFHLAHALASMGQRTLLIDTDLRRPSLHKLCNIENSKGLSNYTTGDCSLDEIIINLPADKNLFAITSGPVPPNPTAILSANRMEDLLKQVYKDFDVVIFDTPPLLGFADAFLVAKKTQGILFTASLGQTKFSQLQAALDELSIAKVPVIGMVANGSKEATEKSYNYYQYYQSSADEINGLSGPIDELGSAQSSWQESLLGRFTKRP